MGGYEFGEFGAGDAGSFKYTFPAVRELALFTGDGPGFEPALVAAQDIRVGFIDCLLQLRDCGELVRQSLVKTKQVE